MSYHGVGVTWEVGVSLALHLGLIGVVVASELITDRGPLLAPPEVMMVKAVALPKQMGRMPDRAMRRPEPVVGQAPEAPAPPPPPTASDMVKRDPKAKQRQGVDSRKAQREALLQQTRRENLLNDLTAPLGPVDQSQTDPDGVDPSEAILGAGAGVSDPVLARYIAACKARIVPNWTPLPAVVAAHPEYVVQLHVKLSATGKMTDPQVYKGSGDTSFDQSAVRAVLKTGSVPAPPRDDLTSLVLTFPAGDKL